MIPSLPPPELSTVDYSLTARLDADAHRVSGAGSITIHNRAERALREIWFHLYMNAFAHKGTVFLRGNGGESGQSRSQSTLRAPGEIRVLRLARVEEPGRNLWTLASEHSPGDPEDKTDIVVPLSSAIEPGATQTFLIEFETTLPEIVERTGYSEDYHFVGQWYPKVARLDASGEYRHFTFHAQAEFASNFGDYDVQIDVPERYLVGHSGREVAERGENGRKVIQASLPSALDFAWTAWPRFEVEERQWAGLLVRFLHPPKMRELSQATWRTLKSALFDFTQRFGPYAHDTLTVVHPPDFADASGGMEYPSLITTGGSPWLDQFGIRWNEAVTTHELGHQWFYGSLASDEYREPFLDESLTTWAECAQLGRRFGNSASFESPWLSLSSWAPLRFQAAWAPKGVSALLPAPDYSSFGVLAAVIYGRAPLALETMRRTVGTAAFDQAMSRFARTYRKRHPSLDDFFAAMSSELGAESSELLKRLLQGETTGYRVGRVQNHLSEAKTSVLIDSEGGLLLPSVVELRFADGSAQTFPITKPTTLVVPKVPELVSVKLDPARSNLLDPDLANNQWQTSALARRKSWLWTTLLTRLGAELTLWSLL